MLFKNRAKITLVCAVFAAAFLGRDLTPKAPIYAPDTVPVAAPALYTRTTVYSLCGHQIVTREKGLSRNETHRENNYCPYHYWFYEQDGCVAIRRMDNQKDSSPMIVLPIFVSTLPYTDQTQLQQGFEVYGEEALQRLIEDYDG